MRLGPELQSNHQLWSIGPNTVSLRRVLQNEPEFAWDEPEVPYIPLGSGATEEEENENIRKSLRLVLKNFCEEKKQEFEAFVDPTVSRGVSTVPAAV